jgi:HD-GYP domain-containing protein (c-di-GMP phosphodiesterase class II)
MGIGNGAPNAQTGPPYQIETANSSHKVKINIQRLKLIHYPRSRPIAFAALCREVQGMQILLFHSDKETREMVGFCLESQMGLEVHRVSTFQEALDVFLEDGAIDLLVTHQQADTDKLFKYLLSTGTKIPVIMIGVSQQEGIADTYPDINVVDRISESDVPEKLTLAIKSQLKDNVEPAVNADYCRISTELLVRVVPLRGDIYIRLSNVKFVKMFRSGAQFSSEDLERFLVKKKVKFLYIKKEESQEFVTKFKEDLAQMVAKATPGDATVFNTISEVQGLIQELSNRLGFNQEVQDMAKQNVQLTLKAIGSSPKLSNVFSGTALSSKNFISSHSVLLANISCSIAAQMVWPSNTTFQKLVLAALFHDFTFQDPALAKISTKQELEDLRTSGADGEERYNLVKLHPVKSSEIVKGLNEVPGDVDFVVLQHHERPDGSGFPKGLRSQQIPPLSAVFIVAHDMLDAMIKEGHAFKLATFLKKMESQYESGAFRKIWKSLAPAEAQAKLSGQGPGEDDGDDDSGDVAA